MLAVRVHKEDIVRWFKMRTGLDIEYEAIDKSSCYAGIVDRDGRPPVWAVMHLQKIDPKSPGTVTLYIGPGYERVSRWIAFVWLINSLGEVKHRGYGTYFELDYKGRLSPIYEERLSTFEPHAIFFDGEDIIIED